MKKENKVTFPIEYLDYLIEDKDGNLGYIMGDSINCIHNIEVQYLNGGFGLYCLDMDCDEYEPLYYIG